MRLLQPAAKALVVRIVLVESLAALETARGFRERATTRA